MFFTPEEKIQLLKRLPSLELSYEPKLHKKVYAPVYYIIPKGPKALVWYTYWKDQNVCLLIKLNERGNYSDVQVFTSVFSDALALGTIIYGTYFLNYNRHYFTCEQLYYYKGEILVKKNFNEKLNYLLDMFRTQVDQVVYTPTSLVVGMPVLTETYEEALAQMDQLPYKTYGVAAAGMSNVIAQQHLPRPNNVSAPHVSAPQQKPVVHVSRPHALAMNAPKAIFKVKAGLAADNYQLYTAENTLYETAMVPTYKCSVMMNTLFRKIKENANLDLLEESDDEAEFENTQMDKFVDLGKTVPMECVYSKRFKNWQPIKIVSACAKIISLNDLQHFSKK